MFFFSVYDDPRDLHSFLHDAVPISWFGGVEEEEVVDGMGWDGMGWDGMGWRCGLSMNMKFGYSIKDVTGKVQEKVRAAIENMTGLEVADVNIRVAGVDVPEEA